MNTKKNRLKFLKLILYFMLLMSFVLSLKSYYYYIELKEEVVGNVKREAHLMQDYMMSVREVFHKQFLSSGIELNDKTLGFLPAHATTLISNIFHKKNEYNFYIRNVSDTPRNRVNMADKEELKAIKYFKSKPKNLEYFEKYSKDGTEYFQFASPIYIKHYCLACHGKREDALPTIRHRYDTAYNYKIGDIRGIVSIKIPNDKIDKIFYKYLEKELIITFFTFIMIIIVILIIFRKMFFQIKDIETTAIDYASKDALTGLYNRKYLLHMKENHRKLLGQDENFIVSFIDIDYFKKVNDTYGHDMGDIVLKEFAKLLKTLSREEDIVCRYGGEEFLVIVYNISREKAFEKFDNIRLMLKEKDIELKNKKINITVSIGLSIGTIEDSIEDMISYADKALYNAKENGRNCTKFYDHSMQ